MFAHIEGNPHLRASNVRNHDSNNAFSGILMLDSSKLQKLHRKKTWSPFKRIIPSVSIYSVRGPWQWSDIAAHNQICHASISESPSIGSGRAFRAI